MAEQTRGTIELTLFAPYNEEVSLLASWNDWQLHLMTKSTDGWWRVAETLADGEHFYKFAIRSKSYFAVNQRLEVFDPYGISVTNDEQERSILWMKGGKRLLIDYQWRHDDQPLPTNDQLVIYELHVGDFSGGNDGVANRWIKGKFKGVIEKLDYLADLGINAVELMPVKEFPGKSWGYNLRSLFAVDSDYGSPADLCWLIDECHARGMRVIIDGVYNHADKDAPLAKIDYEYWFYRENPDPPEFHWGPKFNFGHYDEKLKIYPARKYVVESIQYWVRHFHIDGIRFDATRAIKDFDVMRQFTDAGFDAVGRNKPFFTVAEHIPEDPAIVGYPKGPMVAAWHDSFGKQLQAIATRHERDGAEPWDLEALQQKMNVAANGYGSANHVVNYVVTHDQVRILRQIAEKSLAFGEGAFRRVKLTMALLLTSPGLPMIWMGQEFGAANPKTTEPQRIDWSLLGNKDNKDLHDYTARLVRLRRRTPALGGDQFQAVLMDQSRSLLAYKRWNDAGGVVVVAANLRDVAAGEFVIANAGLQDGAWREEVFGYDRSVIGGVLKDVLGPSEVKIFVKQ